jgi:Tfp pilus assembly protein PilP
MRTFLRACAGLLLAALCASGVVVSATAQAPAQKKPATAAPAKNQPAAVPVTPPAQPKKPVPAAAAKSQPAATPVPPAPVAPPDVERPSGPESYSYKPEGRRDPFLSLVNRAVLSDNRPSLKKPEGLRGLSWDEITLRGIFQGRKGAVALVQGPDTRTYQVRAGDQFFDAVVKAITADSLVVLQEVNDPLSLQKQRERRKTLRVAEEVK